VAESPPCVGEDAERRSRCVDGLFCNPAQIIRRLFHLRDSLHLRISCRRHDHSRDSVKQ
jgi:hypothetical protein